eukprot:CAMPEP_0175792230 /NCGR_PEP_ID=MMETSP0097-20121207/82858_1 /TAXON_ID=311494 /ORGANISM="Alexandrium monilatum, Strain CCMP3105" /LENGTH=520 /DNA_ID=CAMNT_0017103409 /DNA_START=21 /DNA_END=1580 /DNA_ORIENTATION=-
MLDGHLTGTVKLFRGQWGFLTAEDVDGDVFLHLNDSPALANIELKVGETVSFELTSGGPNNEARAINAARLDSDDEGSSSAVLTGHVKSLRRGYGLIDSPSLEGSMYFGERDNPQLKEGELSPGDEVTFELATNPADGRDKAVKVQRVVKVLSACVGQTVRGAVKSFGEGWGFATSTRFAGQILLGRKQVSAAGVALQVGDSIEFEVATCPNGKHEAINITKVGTAGMWSPLPPAGPPRLALAAPPRLALATPPRLALATPPRLALATPPRLALATPPRLALATPPRLALATPPRLALATPPRLALATPPRLALATPPRLALATPPRLALATPPRLALATPPRLALATPPRLALASPPRLALANGGGAAAQAGARDRSRTPRAAPRGQYVGQVKWFRDDWGFLVSDQVSGDIFAKTRDCPNLGQPLQPGEAVSFDIVRRTESSKNNGVAATNVQRLGGGGCTALAAPPATPRQPWGGRGGLAPAAPPATGAVSSQQHVGTVVQVKPPPDSWGFLESPTCD